MRTYLILVLSFSIFSCVSHDYKDSLTEAYNNYRNSIERSTIELKAESYFSEKLLDGKDLSDQSIQEQLMFKDYMIGEPLAFLENSECLTVNGKAEDGLPVAFYIRYRRSVNRLLIDEIQVAFLEREADFVDYGKCPNVD